MLHNEARGCRTVSLFSTDGCSFKRSYCATQTSKDQKIKRQIAPPKQELVLSKCELISMMSDRHNYIALQLQGKKCTFGRSWCFEH